MVEAESLAHLILDSDRKIVYYEEPSREVLIQVALLEVLSVALLVALMMALKVASAVWVEVGENCKV